jgi:protein gp37
MSDLFHDAIPDDFLDSAFTVMALCGQHRFQVLTKRPERMARYIDRLSKSVKPLEEKARERGHTFMFAGHGLLLWPLRNIWLGVSVEDQKTADERIPLLLQTPAAVRFISYEPALGPVDLSSWLPLRCCNGTDCGCMGLPINPPYLNWTIAGGESGAHARPSHPDWFRKVRNDCQAAGVPLFFKQWGEWAIASSENGIIGSLMPETGEYFTWIGIDGKTQNPSSHGLSGSIYSMAKIGKKRSGRLLDGREWREFPDAKWSELPEIT